MTQVSFQDVSISLSGIYDGRSTAGRMYGSGRKAVILSNMNTNDQNEWEPLIVPSAHKDYFILTYNYINSHTDQSGVLADVLSFVKQAGADIIILMGASRGGVTSMQIAAKPDLYQGLAGVAAISAPVDHKGELFFSRDDLARIKIPKLLINTEHDECAAGTRRMFELVTAPKTMIFYDGAEHGTEIFATKKETLVADLVNFADRVSICD